MSPAGASGLLLVPGTASDRVIPLQGLPGALLAHPGGWRSRKGGKHSSVILKVDGLGIEMTPSDARALIASLLAALAQT